MMAMRKKLRRLTTLGTLIIAAIALLDQLGRAPEDRDWHGVVLGVPYDFRPPSLARLVERIWNADDERVLVPTVVGVGWTVNLYQLRRRALLLIA